MNIQIEMKVVIKVKVIALTPTGEAVVPQLPLRFQGKVHP